MVYLISFGAGILAGVLYGVINVRSPAPPAIALIASCFALARSGVSDSSELATSTSAATRSGNSSATLRAI